MKIDLTQYTIDEIIDLRFQCENFINSHEDGYVYICKVRSYGRNWREYPTNTHSLKELCARYDGYDGIVDVYSTNPDLSELYNYGDVLYINSVEDYQKWDSHKDLKSLIEEIEYELEKWNDSDNTSSVEREIFGPFYTQEDLLKYKKELEEYDMSFIAPRKYE